MMILFELILFYLVAIDTCKWEDEHEEIEIKRQYIELMKQQ